MTRRFTGWHMTTILIAFFGVVIAINLVMARYAIGTFGGTVVDNSYVASQHYNRWLSEADKQAKLGWKADVALNPGRQVAVSVSKDAAPVAALTADGVGIHPLGRAAPVSLSFASSESGQLVSHQSLPAGRWIVQITLHRAADTAKLRMPVQ